MRRLARSAIAISVLAAGGVTTAALTAGGANAAAFAGGDFVVYQVGDGSTALSTAAAPVSLVEYAPTGGTPIQTIALPTADSGSVHAVTASGTSTSEGELTRSPDGRFLVATGYDAPPGTQGPTSTYTSSAESLTATVPGPTSTTGDFPRTIARIDGNGLADTSTTLESSDTPSVIRSAATTNGTTFEVAGSPQTDANPSADNQPTASGGGLLSAALGSTSTTVLAGSSSNNLNGVQIDSGNPDGTGAVTFVSSSDSAGRIYSEAAGTLTALNGVTASTLPYGYALVALPGNNHSYLGTGLNTLYVADGSDHEGAVDKYVYSGTKWIEAGKIYLPGVLGLTAVPNGTDSQVSVLATTASNTDTDPTDTTANGVDLLTDPDGTDSGSFGGSFSQIVTAPANDQFRGVAIAPIVPAGPSIVVTKPSATTAVKSGTASIPFAAEVADGEGVSSVTVAIDGGTAIPTTEFGSTNTSDFWTATLPLTGLAAGAHTLTVTATDASPQAVSATVTSHFTIAKPVVTPPKTPKGDIGKGTTSLLSTLVKHKGYTSITVSGAPLHSGKHLGLTTKKTGSATFTYYGKTLTLHLVGGKTSGEITVKIDGKSHLVNLYKTKSGAFTVTFKATKTAAHKVSITSSKKKTKKSKGYVTTLGWLVVA